MDSLPEAEPFLGSQAHARLQDVRHHAVRYYERANEIGTSLRLSLPKTTVSLKHILLAIPLACILLFTALLLPHGRASIHSSATTPSVQAQGACSTARLNSHAIKAPLEPNLAALTSFWPALKDALIEHGRDLPTLERPSYQWGAPSEDSIRDRTDLLTSEEASLIRDRHAGYLQHLPAYPKKAFRGRGIVMLAGGHYSEYAVTALGVLRESGSTLPVEVWRRDEREEKHEWCDEIEQEGMACRRLSDYLDTDILAIADGKEMKVFTMLFSSFEEIVFIDADNMALQPPELLFESAAYKDTGAVLWPDYWKYDNTDWLEYTVGLSDDRTESLWSETTYESGQIVWNKRRHWEALLLATYYNYYGPDLYYTLLNYGYAGWGDKDTFPLALRALQQPFHTIESPPQNVWVNGHVGDRRTGMLQMEPRNSTSESEAEEANAKTFFLHATTIKWSHRDFICNGCLPIWHTESPTDAFVSRWEELTAELHPQLHAPMRILDLDLVQYMPLTSVAVPSASGSPSTKTLDAEVRIWRAMEHAACRSPAWRHARTCTVARRYMTSPAFGFTFVKDSDPRRNLTVMNGGEPWVPSMEVGSCLINPLM